MVTPDFISYSAPSVFRIENFFCLGSPLSVFLSLWWLHLPYNSYSAPSVCRIENFFCLGSPLSVFLSLRWLHLPIVHIQRHLCAGLRTSSAWAPPPVRVPEPVVATPAYNSNSAPSVCRIENFFCLGSPLSVFLSL
jgi:hypothetical protein